LVLFLSQHWQSQSASISNGYYIDDMAGPDAADRMADRRRPPVAVADPVTEQAHRYTDTQIRIPADWDTDTREKLAQQDFTTTYSEHIMTLRLIYDYKNNKQTKKQKPHRSAAQFHQGENDAAM